MTTTFYLAAPFVMRDKAKEVRDQVIEALGWECSSTWLDLHHNVDVPAEVLAQEADTDLGDIMGSDCFILLNWEKSEGKAVETGYAIAEGVPISVIGGATPSTNVFLYLPFINHFETIEEFINAARREQ